MNSGNEIPTRISVKNAVVKWESKIKDAFGDGDVFVDWRDFKIDSKFAEYYTSIERDKLVEVVYQAIINTPGKAICEIGAAFGSCLLPLNKEFGFSVEGFDMPESIPSFCRPLSKQGIETTPYDLHDSNVSSLANADMVICSSVMEHIFVNEHAVVRQLKRFVRIGGVALLVTPNQYQMENLLRIFRGYNSCEKHPFKASYNKGVVVDSRVHPREYTMFEISEAFTHSENWEIVKIWTWPNMEVERNSVRDWLRYFLLKTLFRLPLGRDIFCIARRVS